MLSQELVDYRKRTFVNDYYDIMDINARTKTHFRLVIHVHYSNIHFKHTHPDFMMESKLITKTKVVWLISMLRCSV